MRGSETRSRGSVSLPMEAGLWARACSSSATEEWKPNLTLELRCCTAAHWIPCFSFSERFFRRSLSKGKKSEVHWPHWPESQVATGFWKHYSFMGKLCCVKYSLMSSEYFWCLLMQFGASGHRERRSYSQSWMWDRSFTQQPPGLWREGCRIRTGLC